MTSSSTSTDMANSWKPPGESVYEIRDRKTAVKWTATACRPRLRLQLDPARLCRGVCPGRQQGKFVNDFVAAWTKVMNADPHAANSAAWGRCLSGNSARRPASLEPRPETSTPDR